jgi:hypothetical protein
LSIKLVDITFAPVLKNITYQERQREWPCEALATSLIASAIGKRC